MDCGPSVEVLFLLPSSSAMANLLAKNYEPLLTVVGSLDTTTICFVDIYFFFAVFVSNHNNNVGSCVGWSVCVSV